MDAEGLLVNLIAVPGQPPLQATDVQRCVYSMINSDQQGRLESERELGMDRGQGRRFFVAVKG